MVVGAGGYGTKSRLCTYKSSVPSLTLELSCKLKETRKSGRSSSQSTPLWRKHVKQVISKLLVTLKS